MKIDPNDPAFSYAAEWGYKPGLSIRAELAARAMQGILSRGEARKPCGETTYHPDEIAAYALACADALISELNKEQSH